MSLNNLFYKVDAQYPDTDNPMDLGIYVNTEDSGNKYVIEPKIDISKKVSNIRNQNALLLYISKEDDNGTPFGSSTTKHNCRVYPNRMAGLANGIEFDYNQDNVLIIIFHDNDYYKEVSEYFFNELENYFERTEQSGDYLLVDLAEEESFKKYVGGTEPIIAMPRKAGMTIVRRQLRIS
jgi:hypothetical protein